jgi:hypothetical protein
MHKKYTHQPIPISHEPITSPWSDGRHLGHRPSVLQVPMLSKNPWGNPCWMGETMGKPVKMFPTNPVMARTHPVSYTLFFVNAFSIYAYIKTDLVGGLPPWNYEGWKRNTVIATQKRGANSCACIFGSDFICLSFLGLLLHIWNHQPDLLPFWTCPLIGNVKATIATSPMFLDSSKNWDAVQFVDALSHYLPCFIVTNGYQLLQDFVHPQYFETPPTRTALPSVGTCDLGQDFPFDWWVVMLYSSLHRASQFVAVDYSVVQPCSSHWPGLELLITLARAPIRVNADHQHPLTSMNIH